MKREQKILASTIAALLGGTALSLNALAEIDITGTKTAGYATYASEISTTSGLTIPMATQTIKFNLGGPVGNGSITTSTTAIPAGEQRIARFIIENGTFAADGGTAFGYITGSGVTGLVATSDCAFTSSTSGTTIPHGSNGIEKFSGGKADSNVVSFSIKSQKTGVTEIWSAGCTMGVVLPDIKVTVPGQPVKISYALFSGPLAAADTTTAGLVDADGMYRSNLDIVNFASALKFATNSSGKDATIDVKTKFKRFLGSDASGVSSATVGLFDFHINEKVFGANGVEIATMSTLLGSSAAIKIEGDLTGIYNTGTTASVFLVTDSACTGTALATSKATEWELNTTSPMLSSATFTGVTTLSSSTTVVPASYYLCVSLGGNNTVTDLTGTTAVQIPASADNFTATLLSSGEEASDSYKIPNKSATLKKLIRNGVTLEAPFLNLKTGYDSRIVLAHLNKGADNDAEFFVTLFTDKESKSYISPKTTTGTLKKGTTLKLMAGDLFTVATGSPYARAGVSISFYASSDDIQGAVQHINTVTKEVTTIPMTRPGGARGD